MQNYSTRTSSGRPNQSSTACKVVSLDQPVVVRKHPMRIEKCNAGWEHDFIDYLPRIIPLHSDTELLARGVKNFDVNPDEVVMQFGSWVVTDYGMECLVQYYPIRKERVDEPYWAVHMLKKRFIKPEDFLHCLEAARFYHSHFKGRTYVPPVTIGLRFDILKRDGYRCQICGLTAQDGVRLEVDHKVPKSKGGSDENSNLWTLCFSCNRGKRDRDL